MKDDNYINGSNNEISTLWITNKINSANGGIYMIIDKDILIEKFAKSY